MSLMENRKGVNFDEDVVYYENDENDYVFGSIYDRNIQDLVNGTDIKYVDYDYIMWKGFSPKDYVELLETANNFYKDTTRGRVYLKSFVDFVYESEIKIIPEPEGIIERFNLEFGNEFVTVLMKKILESIDILKPKFKDSFEFIPEATF